MVFQITTPRPAFSRRD